MCNSHILKKKKRSENCKIKENAYANITLLKLKSRYLGKRKLIYK